MASGYQLKYGFLSLIQQIFEHLQVPSTEIQDKQEDPCSHGAYILAGG